MADQTFWLLFYLAKVAFLPGQPYQTFMARILPYPTNLYVLFNDWLSSDYYMSSNKVHDPIYIPEPSIPTTSII